MSEIMNEGCLLFQKVRKIVDGNRSDVVETMRRSLGRLIELKISENY